MDTIEITIIIAALLAVSEALAHIPKVRANGIFQAVWNLLKLLVKKDTRKEVTRREL